MRRTQLYLTDAQRELISRRAEDAGVSQAEIVRGLLDEALGIDSGTAERLAAIEATAGLLADAPDWPDWLRQVRARGAGRRLRELEA